ncbi:MAG: hypothetical protein AAGA48_37675 [Myxococcota bacterium]
MIVSSPCGSLELLDAELEPPGARLDLFIDIDGSQFFPAVTAPSPASVERVVWSGRFDLVGSEPVIVSTWPRQLGQRSVSGPLGPRVTSYGAVLVGREDGAWLFIAGVSQQFDDLVFELSPPDRLTIVWGGTGPRNLPQDGRAFFDPITVALGPNPSDLLEHWRTEMTATNAPEPFGGPLSLFGPVKTPDELDALVAADPEGRVPIVLTDVVTATVRARVDDANRRWMVRIDPFVSDADGPVLRLDGVPLRMDGHPIVDPTTTQGLAIIQAQAEALVRAGVDGAWVVGAPALAWPADRSAPTQSGIAAYRLGLQAFRTGFGNRPIVVEAALPLASRGLADAVALPMSTSAATRVATLSAFAPLGSDVLRLGPMPLAAEAPAAVGLDLAIAVANGGDLYLGAYPNDPVVESWLFDDANSPLLTVMGTATEVHPPWARMAAKFVGTAGMTTLLNAARSPIDLDGPGGERWPDGEIAGPGSRTLPSGTGEIWLPR